MTMMAFAQSAMPAEFVEQILRLEGDAWPSEEPGSAAAWPTHDPALDPVYLLAVENGQLIASLAILRKRIRHGGQLFAAGGLSTVTTRRDARRQGYGQQLAAAARDEMSGLGLDLGLFSCDRHLERLYRCAGWTVIPGAVLVGGTPEAPLRSDASGLDKIILADFFTERARAHNRSFANADIELYPGHIDRLW